MNEFNDEGVRNLARAIIVSATDEYKSRLKSQGKGKSEEYRLIAIERFFYSKWFSLLSENLDPDYLLNKLREDVKSEKETI